MSMEERGSDGGSITVHGVCNYRAEFRNITSNFQHVSELVRELYSNSHDAVATRIGVYPRIGSSLSCLIWVDDGKGMDTRSRTEEENRRCSGDAKTSLEAYFHIGNSTATQGQDLGNFCHGSKLTLAQADALFVLITRTDRMRPNAWFCVVSEDITAELFRSGVRAVLCDEAEVEGLVRGRIDELDDSMQRDFAAAFDRAWAGMKEEGRGTMQVFLSSKEMHTHALCFTEQPHWAVPKKRSMCSDVMDRTMLVSCLRFGTRHGTIFHDATQADFLPIQQAYTPGHVGSYTNFLRQAELRVYTREEERTGIVGGLGGSVQAGDQHQQQHQHHQQQLPFGGGGFRVPYGFPYIPLPKTGVVAPRESDSSSLKARNSLHARFGPAAFSTPDLGVISLMMFTDSIQSRFEYWEPLQRSNYTNGKRCGIDIRKFVGVVICTQGVPIVRADRLDLMSHLPTSSTGMSSLSEEDLRLLQILFGSKDTSATLFIDIQKVRVLPSRTDIIPECYDLLRRDERFRVGVSNVMAEFMSGTSDRRRHHHEILMEVIRTLTRQNKTEHEKNVVQHYQDRMSETLEADRVSLVPKPGLSLPPEATVLLDTLKEAFCLPFRAHEFQLQHVFEMVGRVVRTLAHHLPKDELRFSSFHRCSTWWLRTGLFFGKGVDLQLFPWTRAKDRWCYENPTETASKMMQAEVKVVLGGDSSEFNHPFDLCDYIVAMEAIDGDVITDARRFTGVVRFPVSRSDPLHGIGCYIDDVQNGVIRVPSRTNPSEGLVVPVLLFLPLLRSTFGELCDVVQMPGRPPAKQKATSRGGGGAKRIRAR